MPIVVNLDVMMARRHKGAQFYDGQLRFRNRRRCVLWFFIVGRKAF